MIPMALAGAGSMAGQAGGGPSTATTGPVNNTVTGPSFGTPKPSTGEVVVIVLAVVAVVALLVRR